MNPRLRRRSSASPMIAAPPQRHLSPTPPNPKSLSPPDLCLVGGRSFSMWTSRLPPPSPAKVSGHRSSSDADSRATRQLDPLHYGRRGQRDRATIGHALDAGPPSSRAPACLAVHTLNAAVISETPRRTTLPCREVSRSLWNLVRTLFLSLPV